MGSQGPTLLLFADAYHLVRCHQVIWGGLQQTLGSKAKSKSKSKMKCGVYAELLEYKTEDRPRPAGYTVDQTVPADCEANSAWFVPAPAVHVHVTFIGTVNAPRVYE